jgi:PPK2 family polyphosphate:nucleotide phosphotransferase
MRLKPIDDDTDLGLRDKDADPPRKAPAGGSLKKAIAKETERVGKLQQVLYADGRYALLIVLQGRDAAGKDGAIRHVFAAVDPQGCEVTSFKAPTDLELHHDFLWRIHARVPARGMIGIFNRSHYEDVLVPRVRELVPKKVWSARYEQINAFERMLTENNVVILKFFLHISKKEQRKRLESRLADETKNWKFRVGDLDDRARWDDYTAAYAELLRQCSSPWAPWYLIPSDDKQVRNWLIARCIADRLDELGLEYPRADESVVNMTID